MRTMRGAVVVGVFVGCMSVGNRARADVPSEPPPPARCRGAALAGGLVGATDGSAASGIVLRASNGWRPVPLEGTGIVVGLGGLTVGAVGGTVLSCAIWQPEEHVLPRASFIVAGGLVGGLGAGGAVLALMLPHADNLSQGEGAGNLAAAAFFVGAAAGGFGGYNLHNALFSESAAPVALVPSYVPGGATLGLSGAF